MAEMRGSEKEQTRGAKASSRGERKDPPKAENKAVRRDTKKPNSLLMRIRNSTIGRFIIEAYYELRHKVTWPTTQEARNMTLAVILLSAVIGVLLMLADFGLDRLYFLIVGK